MSDDFIGQLPALIPCQRSLVPLFSVIIGELAKYESWEEADKIANDFIRNIGIDSKASLIRKAVTLNNLSVNRSVLMLYYIHAVIKKGATLRRTPFL